MVMGAEYQEIHSFMNDFNSNQFFSSHNSLNADKFPKLQPFVQQNQFLDIPTPSPNENLAPSSNPSPEGDPHEDSEIFSDIDLTYISQMLMDEDDKIDNFHEYSALEAAEKPFYEILGKNYPPPPDSNHSSDSPDSISPNYANSSSVSGGCGSSSISSGGGVDSGWPYDNKVYQLPEFVSHSSFGSTNSLGNNNVDAIGLSDFLLEQMPAWHFQKGVEEARKFLPSNDKLMIGANFQLKVESKMVDIKSENEEREFMYSLLGSRGRKNPYSDDLGLEEGRSVKQTAVSHEETIRSQEFDEVLLCHGNTVPKTISDIREAFQQVAIKNSQNGSAKGSSGGKGRGKKQPKKEVVDLRTLLIHCAQTVAADDQRSTNELLKQIRHHSSPTGDGSQRLAHYFANGIEARLAGTGSEIYNSYKVKRRTATDFLKAYQLYLAACPFKKISYFFSNQTILNVSEKAARVHVIDFGINFGFQWPSLIQRLSNRQGGPPRLRITGIDFPQPGFRPAERIEETGRRLADYAQSFKVPFDYKAIASKWEDVRIEDLEIEKDEVLVVNCMYQFRYLADETVVIDSPRNIVLNTIRKMNPDVFIHGIVNGSYSAPFFVTRFREALFHFSALFDMLETIVPREDEQRLLIEREIFGREALNVVACEGLERMERPETYKQWQVRNQRAGFVQHSLNREIVKKARDKVKDFYHKDFSMDEDNRWLLQGWKGRIVYAVSSWRPDNVS